MDLKSTDQGGSEDVLQDSDTELIKEPWFEITHEGEQCQSGNYTYGPRFHQRDAVNGV